MASRVTFPAAREDLHGTTFMGVLAFFDLGSTAPCCLRCGTAFGNVEAAAVDALVLEQLQLARDAAAESS